MPARRIRVLQFLTATVRAGAEEVALELVRGLDPQKFRSYLVCPESLLEAFGGDWKAQQAEAFALTLHSPWQWKAARKFVSFLRAHEIDVVHAHMIRAAAMAVPLARLAGVPVVLHTCHGREAWRTSWWKQQYWIDRRLSRWSDATIAVSDSTFDYLVKEKGLDPPRVRVIRNGRSLEGFEASPADLACLRREFQIGPQAPVVGVFGRLEPQKGHGHLLEALPAVLERVPGVKVLFVGDGVLRGDLAALVRAKGLRGHVVFTGYRTDWKSLMALSDLVVLPSLYEGMPLVPIEAASLGRAVVATAVDGTREVVEDGVTGRLVPPREPAPLAEAVIELLLDPQTRSRLAGNARTRAREQFSLARQLKETEALYEALLGSAGALQRRRAA